MTSQDIKTLAAKYFPKVRSYREHLHKHPELSFAEHNTCEFIAEKLDEMNLRFVKGVGGGTGVVAEVGEGDKIVALRADIDALPIQEEGDHSYRSQNSGVMHACGHDVHTSCLLGAAHILKEYEKDLPCRMRLIFQPGEERLPGGASLMIKDNVLDGVSAIIGQHVHPDLEVGKLGYGAGSFMASCDEVFITVEGRGGHAAMPEKVIDPVMISAELIQALQTIVSRRAHPNTPTVLSIGKINSVGGATNVVPDKVKMEGTFRTYDEDWRMKAHDLIRQIAKSTCEAHGANAKVNIVKGYPTLFNDHKITGIVADSLRTFVGSQQTEVISPRMTAEDFSYYSQHVPACFYRLGTASADGRNTSPVHTPTFDIDPKALEIGSGFMAFAALEIANRLVA